MLDVTALSVVERELREQTARLRRVVVLDRGLQVLAHRRRLAELTPEPAEQRDVRSFHMGGDGIEPPTPCL